MEKNYIDIHSHLNDSRFDTDLSDALARMREANVQTIVVGTDYAMSVKAIQLAEAHPDIWATIGLHPTDNHKEIFDTAAYEQLLAHPRVVAIGECGLDYYWPAHDGWPHGEKEEKIRQRELFEHQIAVAQKAGKPLMSHGRSTSRSMDAYEDLLAVLKNFPSVQGNVHFFVGNTNIATQFLDIGFTLSFTGVLTFTHDYDETARFVPLDRIMVETDAPYVAPAPYRGKRNEPAYVVETYKALAAIRDIDEEELSVAVLQNARRVFGI